MTAPGAIGSEDDADLARLLPSVLIVMGVSGSGKTTVAALLAQRLGWIFEDGDWFHPPANVEKMRGGTPLDDEDRRLWLQAISDWIEETRTAGRHGVVACSALKRAYRRVLVADHGDAVRLVYLKGPKELIAKRLSVRQGHFMPPMLLDSQFAILEEPGPDEDPITVSIAADPRTIVEKIVSLLIPNQRSSPGGHSCILAKIRPAKDAKKRSR